MENIDRKELVAWLGLIVQVATLIYTILKFLLFKFFPKKEVDEKC